jgi:retinol dehydrogenase-12
MATMTGKRCIITGASRGIGRATAIALAAQGADVVLVVRDQTRGDAVAKEIRDAGGKADVLVADLSSQVEVRRLADEIRKRYDRIDVLLNNAGVILTDRQTTKDGLEATFATNHIAYFLLTTLLLDVLEKSAPSRIINVASDAHKGARLDFDDLQSARSYSGMRVYARSKLANILFTNELAKRIEAKGVTANSLHPGVIASNFGTNNGGVFGFVLSLARPFFATPEDGAKTSIYLASSPDVANVSGKYFKKSHAILPSKAAQDADSAAKLWRASEEIVAKSA